MARGWHRELRTVFESGTVAGLSDAELLQRFLDGDDAGFRGLVARHGAMVLAVCRDVLRDGHAAEDAFQATFLVLVRKARGLRVQDGLGPWLHGVACRVARHARADAARRHAREGHAAKAPSAFPSPGDTPESAELRGLLHEEIDRLPESFRIPLVLCYLQGLTHEEAARRLRRPVGTVRSRLARGRERLRRRLARRGAVPALAAGVLEGAGPSSRAFVSADLHTSTLAAALAVLKGVSIAGAGAGSAPVTALILSRKVGLLMTLTSLKTAALGTIAGLSVTAAAVVTAGQATTPARPESPSIAQVASPPDRPTEPTPPEPSSSGFMPEDLAHWQRMARLRLERFEAFMKKGVLPRETRDEIQAALERSTSQMKAHQRRWEEELELQRLQLLRARARVARAKAQRELAQAIVDRNTRLNERVKGAISSEEIRRAEAESQLADADFAVSDVDV
ncbi:MAG: RNA polymerase sigma factor, partial [Isosphaeraceae bacterium]